MGLDITGENDYFRFNWSGVRSFNVWNTKHGLPNPFPNWQGDNSGDEVNCAKPAHVKRCKSWVKAFEKKFPNLAEQGIGEAIRYTQFSMYELALSTKNKENESWTNEQQEKWDQYVGLGWYWFLKGQIENKGRFNYY